MNLFIRKEVKMRERKKRKRDTVIQKAAIKLLNEEGFDALSMRKIAQEADIAVGTLYNYYSSKNELILKIMEEQHEDIGDLSLDLIEEYKISEKIDASDFLSKLVERYYERLLIFNKSLLKRLFSLSFSAPHMIDKGISMDKKAMSELHKAIVFLQKKGSLKSEIDANDIVMSIYSLMAIQVMAYIYFYPNDDAQELTTQTNKQINLLLIGIAKEEEK